MGVGFYLGETEMSVTRLRWWWQSSVNILNTKELYPFKRFILYYVIFTSI